MPFRGDTFSQGQYYHVYNRGAGRSAIFLNDVDYDRLLRLLKYHAERYGATVIAYCLMPNHYHILLRQETDVPLSKFMQNVFNAYVQGFNLQQARTGTLFEGRFKHSHVDQWQYLVVLCRYIHLNPVKAKLAKGPEDWPYSNYREWIGTRAGRLVDRAFVQEYFSCAEDYARFVNAAVDQERSASKIWRYMLD
jgi:REP element-mobilizing transposase RayT